MIEPLVEVVDRVLAVVAGLDPVVLALAVMAFTALETTALIGTVVPGDVAVLLAGSTVDSPGRFALVAAAATTGTCLGDLGGYAIGRLVGPRVRVSRFGRMIGERRWRVAEAYLAGRGAPVLVPVRFVAVAHAVTPIVCGTVRMPLRKFALFASLGAVSWACVYTAVGAAAGAAYREYRELGLLTTIGIVGVALVVVLIRRLRRRRSAGHAG
ncbi:MAG: VTT domain-containing protein [Micromonosporaceae bacterium]|jgi:membrane-associated protein